MEHEGNGWELLWLFHKMQNGPFTSPKRATLCFLMDGLYPLTVHQTLKGLEGAKEWK
jgi:hypothetical protein